MRTENNLSKKWDIKTRELEQDIARLRLELSEKESKKKLRREQHCTKIFSDDRFFS